MKTKILILFACLAGSGFLRAQDPGQAYLDRMNYIFQYVDKSRIATGLLSDYIPAVNGACACFFILKNFS
jgi:hypothetical protein